MCAIPLAVMFFLLTTPVTIYFILLFNAADFVNPRPVPSVAQVILTLLALINHAIDFLLYVMTSVYFRAELCAMVCCKDYQVASSSNTATIMSVMSHLGTHLRDLPIILVHAWRNDTFVED